jgi:hypothetical protein
VSSVRVEWGFIKTLVHRHAPHGVKHQFILAHPRISVSTFCNRFSFSFLILYVWCVTHSIRPYYFRLIRVVPSAASIFHPRQKKSCCQDYLLRQPKHVREVTSDRVEVRLETNNELWHQCNSPTSIFMRQFHVTVSYWQESLLI